MRIRLPDDTEGHLVTQSITMEFTTPALPPRPVFYGLIMLDDHTLTTRSLEGATAIVRPTTTGAR